VSYSIVSMSFNLNSKYVDSNKSSVDSVCYLCQSIICISAVAEVWVSTASTTGLV